MDRETFTVLLWHKSAGFSINQIQKELVTTEISHLCTEFWLQ